MLQLFYSPGACSLAPHILLKASGIPYKGVSIPVKNGSFPAEYAHLNPKKQVPFLLLGDGKTISEGPAIMTAIAQLAPEHGYLGASPMETVRTYEWLNWMCETLHGQAYGQIFSPRRFSSDESTWRSIQDKGQERIRECYDYIENKVANSSEQNGAPGVNAVDALLVVFYRWGRAQGIEMSKLYPRYSKRMLDFAELAIVKATFAEEGIEMPEE